ncbi:DNA polymerase III subunit gamma and tau, partial [Actinotalea sp. AC32]|nr:DNA polymerase III subunit gamma and tau [Actinotalea sp. AC32]
MTQALYRRYRPETFTEVIGQEHVTGPLMQALRAGKYTHAYLFSGPRGCGKTTSARILARCLNCAEGPTDTPCGVCPSCVELARGGAGSLDVVEIDAASHNGVDDARDLRERAAFAPARDRFKIFILDEAHMVTPQGFNALLKIVEEPPPHVKFVFATTEPDKVIGTIRSRTHHYPFRLVPPDTLQPYLEQVCQAEGVAVGSGVLPLVVRAGGGSVRDSLSVLDQLVAGADERGLDYERAVALLGYTHAALLDDAVDAVAARDGASAFRVVDRVISSGHEPRRFVEDLLERLRDLIVIAASGDAARAVLRDLPTDQLERMAAQASTLGPAELSRSADLVNEALTEMTGATSPRLHLELLVARLLLPAVDDGARGLAPRVERLEREMTGGVRALPASAGAAAVPVATVRPEPAPAAPVATPAPDAEVPARSATRAPLPAVPDDDGDAGEGPATGPARTTPRGGADGAIDGDSRSTANGPTADQRTADDEREASPDASRAPAQGAVTHGPAAPAAAAPRAPQAPSGPAAPGPAEPAPAAPAPAATAASDEPRGRADQPAAGHGARQDASAPGARPAPDDLPHSPAATGPAGGVDAETVRRRWAEVLQTLKGLRMATWVLVSQNAHVAGITGDRLTLAFSTPQLATTFRSGPHADNVRRALHETLGLEVRVETALADEPPAPAPSSSTPAADSGPRAVSAAEAAASWDVPVARVAPAAGPEGERPATSDRPGRTDTTTGPGQGSSPGRPGAPDTTGGDRPSGRSAVVEG